MGSRRAFDLIVMALLMTGMSMVSAEVIEDLMEFEDRPVRVVVPFITAYMQAFADRSINALEEVLLIDPVIGR